jgi:hypothetical protein
MNEAFLKSVRATASTWIDCAAIMKANQLFIVYKRVVSVVVAVAPAGFIVILLPGRTALHPLLCNSSHMDMHKNNNNDNTTLSKSQNLGNIVLQSLRNCLRNCLNLLL